MGAGLGLRGRIALDARDECGWRLHADPPTLLLSTLFSLP